MLILLNTFESCPEGEIAHDIVGQVVRPVAHILRDRPSLLIAPRPKSRAPESDVLQDQGFCRSKCCIGESVGQHSSSKGMLASVDLTVRTESAGTSINCAIPVGFLNIGLSRRVDLF